MISAPLWVCLPLMSFRPRDNMKDSSEEGSHELSTAMTEYFCFYQEINTIVWFGHEISSQNSPCPILRSAESVRFEESKFLYLFRHLLYCVPTHGLFLSPKSPTPCSLQQRISVGNTNILSSGPGAVHWPMYCKLFGDEPSRFLPNVELFCWQLW